MICIVTTLFSAAVIPITSIIQVLVIHLYSFSSNIANSLLPKNAELEALNTVLSPLYLSGRPEKIYELLMLKETCMSVPEVYFVFYRTEVTA